MELAVENPSQTLWHKYPRGFRPRRGLNWGFLGLLYTSFYMCRYNLSIANKSISDEFGYSHDQMGKIIATGCWPTPLVRSLTAC